MVDGACGCEAGSRGVGPVAHGGSVGGAWVAHGWRRWPFEEEGLCDQIMASGLEKRKKEEGYFGHLMVVYQRSCFNKWFIRTDSTLLVKLFFKPNPIKTY